MNTNTILEKKIDNIIKAIRRDLIGKMEAYNQFHGYTKALAEFGIITEETAVYYRLELAKVSF